MTNGPSPSELHPMAGFPQVCFIRNTVNAPNVEIGEYTYYDDPAGAENFVRDNVLYHYSFIGDKLVIGRYCALATGVQFIMNGANHKMSGFSTYPFGIFSKGWEAAQPAPGDLPYKGDTVVGNDVWIGYNALIMPGVKIGDGAIVAARSVVVSDVEPYAIVGGNPARVIRKRFTDKTCAELQKIAWWNWPVDKVTLHLRHIVRGDLDILRTASRLEPVGSAESIAEVVKLAAETWLAHYTPIIGGAQVGYMLEKFQSAPAIAQQIAEGYTYYLLRDTQQMLGYCAITGNFLSKIYVHPDKRGQGLGKAMLQYCAAEMRARGEKILWLTVNRDNQESIAFYESQGLRNAGCIKQDIGNGFVMDDFRMELDLL